jgi:hypothetical protein
VLNAVIWPASRIVKQPMRVKFYWVPPTVTNPVAANVIMKPDYPLHERSATYMATV